MELKDYFKIIGKHFWILVIVVVLTTGFAFYFTQKKPTSFIASTTFTVDRVSALKQSQVNYYLYDNYYNVQSANSYAQVVASWFSSPSFVTSIYQKAGVEVPNIPQAKLGKIFKTTATLQSSVIYVTSSGVDQYQLQKLMNSAFEVSQAKSSELNKDGSNYYQITKFEPVVSKNESNLLLNSIIGLFAGIILGIIVSFAIEYFKED